MPAQNSIWVFIEQTDGKIADVSLELIGKARELAEPLGYEVVGLLCGLTADCTDLQVADYLVKKENKVYPNLLYQIRPAFGGNLIATIVNPHTRPQMATVREGVMRMPVADVARKGVVE